MNEFSAAGIVAMLVGLWIGHDKPYPHNGFAIGVFVAGAVLLLLNVYLSSWLTDYIWWRRGWTDDQQATPDAEKNETYRGQL